MKKYKKYIIFVFIIIAFCISICFVPIDATRFVPQVEKQFQDELGIKIHIEKLIFRFGPALKIKAPTMHLLYSDGQKFGQLDNVKFFVPWSTLFKDDVHVQRIYADKFIIKTNSTDKYLPELLNKINAKEYEAYPNLQFKNYNVMYKIPKSNKEYALKGQNLEITKLESYKNIKLSTDGDFYINDKQYINYDISYIPKVELNNKPNADFDISNFVEQVEGMDFHADIMANLELYQDTEKAVLMSGSVNIDNISVLDPKKLNPKSFIYLTFLGNRIGVLSNIYAIGNKKIYIQGVVDNSKKPVVDLKVKTDEIKLADIYQKVKLLFDCSKFKDIDSIDGNMLADFTLKGDLKKIKSSGFMKITGASIKSGNFSMKNIDSDIDFSNNVISVTKAVGYVNSAPVTIKGKISNDINMEVLMDKVELKHLIPETFGIKNGTLSLNAIISGTLDNVAHKEKIQINNFKSQKDKTLISFDSLNVDTNKDNTALISNLVIKSKLTENIKLPSMKLIIEQDKIRIPDTNIFMPNSKIQFKSEINNYNSNKLTFNTIFDGYINSKDLSGITKDSIVYPIKFNISGNKDVQNIEGQIQLVNAKYLDEPSIVNINTKVENNSLKIEDLSISSFTGNLSNVFKNNLKGNKKILISGNIENLKDPVLKNIRVFIPQQINLNVNDILLQLKGDIFINGSLNNPEIVGQITAQNIIVQFMQLMINNATVDFNKNIATVNAPVIKVSDTSTGINAVISTDFSKQLLVKSINVKSKFLNADTLLMYEDKFLSTYPVKIASGKLYAERASMTVYNSPIYFAALNCDLSMADNIMKFSDVSAELYNGKLAGNIEYNLKQENFAANVQGRGVSAKPIFDLVALNKDTVSGAMDFDTSLSGNLTTKQSLNGNIKFVVKNGHMGTLGKLEHLLYAQNVIADNMLRTSLSVVTKAITLKDTGLFKYLRGNINMKDGIANIDFLQSQGPLMSLFIKGQYSPITDYAKLTVLGRLSDELIAGLGSFGEFSFNKLMIMLTGEDNNKYNIKTEDLDKLPQLPMTNTKEFRTVINGILEKPSSVIQFNWVSYTQKSLRQREIPTSDEKVPDFIEALPY